MNIRVLTDEPEIIVSNCKMRPICCYSASNSVGLFLKLAAMDESGAGVVVPACCTLHFAPRARMRRGDRGGGGARRGGQGGRCH